MSSRRTPTTSVATPAPTGTSQLPAPTTKSRSRTTGSTVLHAQQKRAIAGRPAVQAAVALPLRLNLPTGFNPGSTTRKSAKPLDSGSRVEVALNADLRAIGIDVWRLPGLKYTRMTGQINRPDAGGYLPELEPYTTTLSPNVTAGRNRPDMNVVVEYKGQRVGGSVQSKIGPAIHDLARLADLFKVAGVLVMDAPGISESMINSFRAQGARELITVVTRDEITAGLVGRIVAHAQQRRRLQGRQLRAARKGFSFTPTAANRSMEHAWAARIQETKDYRSMVRSQEAAARLALISGAGTP